MSDYVYKFESALDIYSFFRSKDLVGDFLRFFFNFSIEYSKKIEDAGDEKPFVIQYVKEGSQYQTDYQFFIYVVAKWVAKLTNDDGNIASVLREYAVTSLSLKDSLRKRNRIGFSYFLGEVLMIVINRTKGKKYTGTNSTNIDYLNTHMEKVVSYNGNYYDIKLIGINSKQVKYFMPEWEEYAEANKEYLFQNESVQVAFFRKAVSDFWLKKESEGIKKISMFNIFDTDINGDISKIEERNLTI